MTTSKVMINHSLGRGEVYKLCMISRTPSLVTPNVFAILWLLMDVMDKKLKYTCLLITVLDCKYIIVVLSCSVNT